MVYRWILAYWTISLYDLTALSTTDKLKNSFTEKISENNENKECNHDRNTNYKAISSPKPPNWLHIK